MSSSRFSCPFCLNRTGSLGKRPFEKHLSIDPQLGIYHCFRCGASGRIFQWLASKLGIAFSEDDYQQVEKEKVPKDLSLERLYPINPLINAPILGRCVKYLVQERGLTEEQIERFDISFVADSNKAFGWLIGSYAFPLNDPVYSDRFVFRKRQGGYASPGIPSDALFNAEIIDEIDDKVYVVEGPIDAIKIYPLSGIAVLGRDISEERLDRLSIIPNDLVIAMDGDSWIYSMSIGNQLKLRGKENVSWIRLDPGYDPGEIGISIEDYQEHS